MRKLLLCCLLLCVLLSAAAPTLADDILVGSDTPRWGEVNLGMIDFPDPFIVTVLSGGPFNAQAQDGIPAECRGFVSGNPDYRVNMVADDWALLRIFAVSEGDTTLIVQLPDGSWQCNDDGGAAALPLSPVVDITNPELGPYNIWVGSFQGDELLGAYLMITENASTAPGQIVTPLISGTASSTTAAGSAEGSDSTLNCSSGLNFACTPNYGTAALEAGFTNDPYTVRITSGGSVNVTEQGLPAECRGNVTTPPDFRLNLSSTSARIRIYFVADHVGDDTTLIVNSGSGTWVCNDDYPNANFNPMVEFNNASAGQYDIWVGSFTPGEFVGGTLYITEMDRTPANP
ncbi:MAG: hypothetical protein U0694_23095 [Anaerolineae bacterium]